MKLYFLPRSLLRKTTALFLSWPILVLQVYEWMQRPWWLPPIEVLRWMLWIGAPLTVLLMVSQWRPGHFSRSLRHFTLGLWIVTSVLMAILQKSTHLGFLALLVMLFALFVETLIQKEHQKAYWGKWIPWFQGHEKPVAHLKVSLNRESEPLDLPLISIDPEGVCILAKKILDVKPWVKNGITLTLQGFDRSVEVTAKLIHSHRRRKTLGFQFVPSTVDQKKEFLDFFEWIRARTN